MADRTSAEIFGAIFATLADELPDNTIRQRIALKFWKMSRQYDFSDCQMEEDDALTTLGLARQVPNIEYPDEGPLTEYGPVALNGSEAGK